MLKGYYQVPMNPDDKQKTAFSSPLGKYEFSRMPFGLKNAPATFQRLVDTLFDGTQWYIVAYIDDVGVYSHEWVEHLQHLREALNRIQGAGLTLRPDKCLIGASSCEFLGHKVRGGVVKPLEAKVEAVTRFSRPTTKQDVHAFLGLTGYYRRFIPEYAKRTGHLTDALGGKRPEKVEWTLQMQGEFEDLKAALSGDTVLHAPDFKCDFTLQTDASCRAIGAVLSQHFEEEGGERPIAYFSRKLNGAQQRYTATEKECLAIVQAIKHFAVYLIGRRFSLQTDHKALQKLKTMDNDIQRLMRWSMSLQPYHFNVKYRPGKELGNGSTSRGGGGRCQGCRS